MPHKFGQRIKDFLFSSPTEETVGLPEAPKQGFMTKSEEMEEIHHALEHPLGGGSHKRAHDGEEHHKAKDPKTLGKKIKDFLFEAPTEETVGLPPVDHHPTKSEALNEIHNALEHPFSGHKAGEAQRK